MQGDIALFKSEGPGLLRWLARLAGMKYYHAALVVLENVIIEAVWPRVRLRVLDFEGLDFVRPVATSRKQRTDVVLAALRSLRKGERYNLPRVIYALLSWLIRKRTRREILPLAVYCSNGVAKWWQAAGVTLCLGLSDPMPDDIAESPRVERI